mmetsp:Transcript_58945/g.108911  ORF Transcript_58945/g.108911 Transcript_58945/m.108911 type:complete len:200 (+) Transcript_58945:201-800(+)
MALIASQSSSARPGSEGCSHSLYSVSAMRLALPYISSSSARSACGRRSIIAVSRKMFWRRTSTVLAFFARISRLPFRSILPFSAASAISRSAAFFSSSKASFLASASANWAASCSCVRFLFLSFCWSSLSHVWLLLWASQSTRPHSGHQNCSNIWLTTKGMVPENRFLVASLPHSAHFSFRNSLNSLVTNASKSDLGNR